MEGMYMKVIEGTYLKIVEGHYLEVDAKSMMPTGLCSIDQEDKLVGVKSPVGEFYILDFEEKIVFVPVSKVIEYPPGG